VMPNIGRIELEAFQWCDRPMRDVGPEAAPFDDVTLTSKLGKHSADLSLAVAQGRHFAEVVITHYAPSGAGIRITLTDVMIVSYSLTPDQRESWALSFVKAKFEQIPADEQ
jgi:type VI protein secretion system component Hcp